MTGTLKLRECVTLTDRQDINGTMQDDATALGAEHNKYKEVGTSGRNIIAHLWGRVDGEAQLRLLAVVD
jgi:hypothetical protein